MKLTLLLFTVLTAVYSLGQATYTFSNSTSQSIAASGSANKTVAVSGVPTTGMVLRQVNISFGDGTGSTANVFNVTMTLTDPAGNVITLLSPTSFDGAIGTQGYFNIHLRDHAALKTPANQKAAMSSTISKGYPFYYGYYKPQGSFASFNTTTSVNGNWVLGMSNTNAGARLFTKVELIFGPAINVIDIRSSAGNTSCTNRQCVQTGEVYWGKNTGYPTNQTSAPPNTVGTCAWNAQKDNMAWYYFVASSTTAEVSISGFSQIQESSVFKSPNCSTYSVVTGGCESDMFAGSAHVEKYYNGTYASGYAWNHGYKLTGLTVGNQYIFVIDGQSGVNSEFYVELLNGGSSGCTPLPVELSLFVAREKDSRNLINWVTESEKNCAYFQVERSDDGINWKTICTVTGGGNSQEEMNYGIVDIEYGQEINYYKLIQVDFDGKVKEYGPISVDNRKSISPITKRINLMGQEVGPDYRGIVIILLENGESFKILQ